MNDAGLEPLILSLASLGSPIEELNISGNQISDAVCKLLSDNIRGGKCKNLCSIILEECPKVTEDGRRILKIAQMKAQGNKGNAKLNQMAHDAKKRDQIDIAGSD